jgi:putative aldouronate transport system permease protein
MRYKKSIWEYMFDIFNHVFLFSILVITLYPMWYVIVSSVSDGSLLLTHSGLLLKPLGWDLSSYKYVFNNPKILSGYRNTLIVVVAGTILNVIATSFAAYVLSRKNVYWKNFLMVVIVITMFFSGGLVPLYLVIKNLQLVNTLWVLMIPNLVSTYNIIVMRTYFNGIPVEIEESAVIDGANHFIILFRLIIPLSMPVIAVMILWYGVGHWNAWFNAYIFINKGHLYPLQLVLRQILIQGSILQATTGSEIADEQKIALAETIKYAVIVVATLPVLFIYPFLQKYFVKGVMIGAIKG